LLEYNGRELVLLTHTIKLKTGPPQHFDLLLAPLSAQLGPTELWCIDDTIRFKTGPTWALMYLQH